MKTKVSGLNLWATKQKAPQLAALWQAQQCGALVKNEIGALVG